MRCMPWVYSVPPTSDSAPPPGFTGRGAVDALLRALGLAAALGLEVRDRLLDLRLVLGLAGFLDHLGRDSGRRELPEHACHVWPPSGCLQCRCPNERRLNHDPAMWLDLPQRGAVDLPTLPGHANCRPTTHGQVRTPVSDAVTITLRFCAAAAG